MPAPRAATSLAFEDPHADVARLIDRRLARSSAPVTDVPEEG